MADTIAYHNLGSNEVLATPYAAEWGNSFFLPKGTEIAGGAGITNGGYDTAPLSRADALDQIKTWLFKTYPIGDNIRWESINGHYLWQHYAAEWGAASVGSEVGETISSTQAHYAFTRGAARQYNIPWTAVFSFWHQGYINDYTGNAVWGASSTATGGHSPSLYKRSMISAYMGGASHFYPEAGAVINFTSEKDENGNYKLSPVGEMTKQLNSFVGKNSDVGVSYNPFGIVIDYYHGMFPGDTVIASKQAFQAFSYTQGDEMTYELIDKFFPGSWKTIGNDESTYQVNGPYGDTCDVLLQNASAEVIGSYPCIILSGNLNLSEAEAQKYTAYAENGGTLILNSAFLRFFPEYSALYGGTGRQTVATGKGEVIIYGPDYSLTELDGIIREKLAEYIPFSISENVEYLVNVKKNSVILTLINNSGYYYDRQNGEYIDETKAISLDVSYTKKGKVKKIKELWSGKTLSADSRSVTVKLAPGEVKILEFSF